MASKSKRRPENVAGDFFVDDTCIDCDTCRWMAPLTFDELGDMSRVFAQPETEAELEAALQALVACPTASIGTVEKHDVKRVAAEFPLLVAENIYHCGYHHEASFGAASYLIVRPEGNVLVDSPRFAAPLVRGLERLGGVRTLFLTHQDDVAEHAQFREHFGCERILHADDAHGELLSLERLIEGEDDVELAPDLRIIPVPGHTRGSACLLQGDRFLFSGDHVAWSERLGQVYAFRSACWYNWDAQIASMRRLAGHRFSWILPGHGRRCTFPESEMSARMAACVAWMLKVR